MLTMSAPDPTPGEFPAPNRMRERGVTALLMGAISVLVAGCASIGGPAVLDAKGLTAAVYEPDGSSFDVLAKGVIVDLGGGCLGIDRTSDHQKLIVAFPVGTRLSSDGTITVEGDGTLTVGDTVQYTGSDEKRKTKPRVPLAIPEACPSDLDIWYFLPLATG